MTSAADDFLAVGTVRWLLRELTVAMGHSDGVDHDSLTRELIAGAHSWQLGDWASAVNRIRAAFEVLTQARERFYAVDAYLIDLCLVDRSMGAGVLKEPLRMPIPITLVATAQAIENQGLHDPGAMAALRQAIADGWADVAGGTYAEGEDSLLPLESIVWQFRHGCEIYRAHLDDRNVETYARRRFGLYPQLPQIAKRFGFRYALHLGFDAGRFPVCAETKRLWESPDGSYLESLTRPPLAADRPSQGWLLPWRLAATMKNDHVAAVPLAHWPLPVAPWYIDLRRMASYSPVLGRFTTLNDFFHLTDRPYESIRPEPDAYVSPYLSQAAARKERDPISRLVRHHRSRARLAAAGTIHALERAIAATAVTPADGNPPCVPADLPTLASAEELAETGRYDESATALERLTPAWSEALAARILEVRRRPRRPRRRRPSGLPGHQSAEHTAAGRRDLARRGARPASRRAAPGRPVHRRRRVRHRRSPRIRLCLGARRDQSERPAATSAGLSARERRLKNDSIEIEVDAGTGGIRSVAAVGEPTARLGQQLVMTGLVDAQGKPSTSKMRVDKFEVELWRTGTRSGDVDRQSDRSTPGESPGVVHAAISALGRAAHPRNRHHARRPGSRLARAARRRPIRGLSIWLADGPGPTPIPWSALGSSLARDHGIRTARSPRFL